MSRVLNVDFSIKGKPKGTHKHRVDSDDAAGAAKEIVASLAQEFRCDASDVKITSIVDPSVKQVETDPPKPPENAPPADDPPKDPPKDPPADDAKKASQSKPPTK